MDLRSLSREAGGEERRELLQWNHCIHEGWEDPPFLHLGVETPPLATVSLLCWEEGVEEPFRLCLASGRLLSLGTILSPETFSSFSAYVYFCTSISLISDDPSAISNYFRVLSEMISPTNYLCHFGFVNHKEKEMQIKWLCFLSRGGILTVLTPWLQRNLQMSFSPL